MEARQRLLQLLTYSGIPQAEVARRMGESTQWLNHRVLGRTEIKADEVVRIADALQIDPCDFFRENNPWERSTPPMQSREDKLVAAMMEGITANLTPGDLDATRRVLDALEMLLKPPEPPINHNERAG